MCPCVIDCRRKDGYLQEVEFSTERMLAMNIVLRLFSPEGMIQCADDGTFAMMANRINNHCCHCITYSII